MASFQFVPRKLAKHVHNQRFSSVQALGQNIDREDATSTHTPFKDKEDVIEPHAVVGKKYSDDDYTILFSLALADHALWADPDLRRKLEWGEGNGGNTTGNERFVPLSYLLCHSPILSDIRSSASVELVVAKALRSCATDMFEVRMMVSRKSQFNCDIDDFGVYEVRKNTWANGLPSASRVYSRDDWERRTIYLENIPPQYRSIVMIARFSLLLLTQNHGSPPSVVHIQNVTLPPHQQDKPGDYPKCKGFALVTFSLLEDVKKLLADWPWDRNRPRTDQDQESVAVQEAAKFGFRTLSKCQWDQLKEEYLAYRQKLLDEILAFQSVPSNGLPNSAMSYHDGREESSRNAPSLSAESITDHLSPYPFGCLVFVRNVHPETNKTTLRALFSTAFGAYAGANQLPGDGLDYVDFQKGMDSCHLRLTSPQHAQVLVDYFLSYPKVQSQGLDGVGTSLNNSNNTSKVLQAEIVHGRREEVYWEKVPEKVRQQAVQRAIAQEQPAKGVQEAQAASETRTRKRRRKRDKVMIPTQ